MTPRELMEWQVLMRLEAQERGERVTAPKSETTKIVSPEAAAKRLEAFLAKRHQGLHQKPSAARGKPPDPLPRDDRG